MKRNFEIWGLRIEILGFVSLLLGTFWQTNFSGWWDKQLLEWQYCIQHEVNLAILDSLQKISNIQVAEDKQRKKKMAKSVAEKIEYARSYLYREREKRYRAMDIGQALLFSRIEEFLMIFGVICFLVGKYITLQGVKKYTVKGGKT